MFYSVNNIYNLLFLNSFEKYLMVIKHYYSIILFFLTPFTYFQIISVVLFQILMENRYHLPPFILKIVPMV